jgi:LAO/AO transport system kinase
MKDEDKSAENSALHIQKGILQPEDVNVESAKRFKAVRKKIKTAEQFAEGILKGDISVLSTAVTMTESTLPEHQKIASEIINFCLPYAEKSVRIGITGVPGAGKSTFIESLGMFLILKGKKTAVLAVDPSGERSGGSILGDKTRMVQLSVSDRAFIRPSPSAGTPGGVARKTAESIILCEAAGFDTIFVETVGVGQSETAVHSMTDFFLLLLIAGAGDELQGIKRGIMEMADAVVINKAEGDNLIKAQLAASQYKNALHFFPPADSGVEPQTACVSALENTGIEDVWNIVENYVSKTKENGYFFTNRKEQARFRMRETISEQLKNRFYEDEKRAAKILETEKAVVEGKLNPYQAAALLLEEYFK